jgi:hypothetical protein
MIGWASRGRVLLLITHCVGDAKRKYGEGRMPTLRQIEREAFNLGADGYPREADAEEHLIELEKYRSATLSVMARPSIGKPAPSASEEKIHTGMAAHGL